MFTGWETFYELVGTVAGALISLLFLVVTLTSGVGRDRASRGTRLYMTPTVFHLGMVIVVAANALAPRAPPVATQLVLAGAALWALAYMLWIGREFLPDRQPDPAHWSDAWCYAIAPIALYLALTAAALALIVWPELAARAVGLTTLVLLLTAIRNAWDLVTWLAPHNPQVDGAKPGEPS